jgi:hypothetical protein
MVEQVAAQGAKLALPIGQGARRPALRVVGLALRVIGIAFVLLPCACGGREEAPPAAPPLQPVAEAEAPAAAPAEPASAGAPPAAEGLAALRPLAGRYPHEVDLWQREPLAGRLRALLGEERFAVLLGNLEVTGPLGEEDGVLYVTGNKAHQGGVDAAAVVIDPRQDVIWVWMLVAGRPEAVAERDVELVVPEDVRITLENVESDADGVDAEAP